MPCPFDLLLGISELAGPRGEGVGRALMAVRRAARLGLLEMLPAATAGKLWLESKIIYRVYRALKLNLHRATHIVFFREPRNLIY